MDATERQKEFDAAKMKKARERLRWNLAQLARKIGVSRSLVFYYENGKRTPRVSTLRRIEKALNLKKGELLP